MPDYVNYAIEEAPTQIALSKNIQTDRFEGWAVGRIITAADVGGSAILGDIGNANWWETVKASAFPVCSGKTLVIRVFADADGGTVSLEFLAKSKKGPGETSRILHDSMPADSLIGAFTCSGRGYLGFNPVTNVVVAGTNWFDCSAFTAHAAHVDNRVREYPSGTATGATKYFSIDGLGDADILPLCYVAPSGSATQIMVAYRIVE